MKVLRMFFPVSILVVVLLTGPSFAQDAEKIASQAEELEIKKHIIRIWMTERGKEESDIGWLVDELREFRDKYDNMEYSFEYDGDTYTPASTQALVSFYAVWLDQDKGIEEWIRFISCYPDSEYVLAAYAELGYNFQEKREYEKAIEYYSKYIANRDRFPKLSDYLMIGGVGISIEKDGLREKAIAECYEQVKDYANALLFWEQYRGLQQEHSDEALEAEVKIEMLQDLFQKARSKNITQQRKIESAIVRPDSLKSYLDNVTYYNLQLDAVLIDMYLYFGWAPEEKEAMKKASDEAILHLAYIKKQIEELDTPEAARDMEGIHLEVIDKLQKIYKDVESKDLEETDKEFEEFGDLVSQYFEVYNKLLQGQSKEEEWKEETLPHPQFESRTDEEDYNRALEFMEQDEYEKAYDMLQKLRNKYSGTSTIESSILLNISDCIVKALYGSEGGISDVQNPEEKGKDILEGIINANDYSPVLFDAFLRWRTLSQSIEYGMSNFSKIPNWEYNEERKNLIGIIKTYTKEHPDDTWAERQIKLLLFLPNIERGGLFGNSNLTFWAGLYSKINQKVEK